MKVKLKIGKVFNGAVWMADSEIDEKIAPVGELKKMVEAGEAEVVGAPARVVPAPREEKDK